MPRQYWKRQVRIIRPNGRVVRDTQEYGKYLLEAGLAEPVPEEKRFTVRLIDTSNFKEELVYARGRPLKAIPSPENPDRFCPKRKRCRPPRLKLSEEEKEFRSYKRTYQRKCA